MRKITNRFGSTKKYPLRILGIFFVISSAFLLLATSSWPCTISGYVRFANGIGLSGVTMSGLPGTPVITNTSGYYSRSVTTTPWSGTVTPTLSGYTFNPASITYTNVTSDVKQDYTAKATATVTLSNLTQTYTGSPLTPTATTNPSGLPIVWTGAPQTNAGSYSVTATVNDPNYTGSASGTFVINKGTPTINVTPYNVPYDGNVHTATGAATGVKGEALSGLDLSGTTHTNAGSYNDIWTFTDVTGNYNNASGTVSDQINKATVTAITFGDLTTQTYTGNPLTPTVTTNPPNLGINWSGTPGLPWINAGTYSVTATVNDPNYTGSASNTFVINKATPTATLAVSNSPQTYSGSGQAATVTITASSVPGSVANILTGGAATQTNAGTYAVTADFVPNDTTNYNTLTGLSAGNFVIDKATPIITWDNPADITYPTALGDAQLNAAANYLSLPVPGSFDYNPPSCGSPPLNPGNGQILRVDFTPDDQTNYTFASATVSINVLVPKVTKEQIFDSWICTQTDASGYPVAMYLCASSDCSSCMTNPMTNLNRCVNSPLSDVAFLAGQLKWVGPGSETVDFVTSKTEDSVTSNIIYRCIEGIDLCFSCGGGPPWACDPSIPTLLSTPSVNTTVQEKIDDVWLCAESPDESGCFQTIYSCPNATDQNPCPCVPDDTNKWPLSTLSNVAFLAGQLKWVGPGSDNLTCETVYFVTTSCIYKCISDTGDCFVYPPSCAQ